MDLLNSLSSQLPIALRQNNYLQSVLKSLRQTVPAFREDYATIVHGDVRHSNWIETDSGFIYLVDWDSVPLNRSDDGCGSCFKSLHSRFPVAGLVGLLRL